MKVHLGTIFRFNKQRVQAAANELESSFKYSVKSQTKCVLSNTNADDMSRL